MSKIYIICMLILSAILGSDQNMAMDYDILSQKSSSQLMEDGREYFQQRKPGKALLCFQIVSDRYEKQPDAESAKLCVKALNNSGCVYKFFYYDYIQSFEYFTKAYNLCEQINYKSFMPVILVNLGDLLNDYGTIYNSNKVTHQADSILNRCITESIEEKNWELLTTAFFNLATSNHDINLSKYKAIFSKDIPQDTPDLQYVRLLYKGLESMQAKRFGEARNFFNRQFATITTRWQPARDTIATYMNIAQTYKLEDNYSKAAENLENALAAAGSDDIKDLNANIYRQLSECYAMTGDSTVAQKYRVRYLEQIEQMQDTRLNNIGELIYFNELHREIAKSQELAVKHRINAIILIAISLILIIVIAFTVYIWRQNRILHAREKTLYEKYRESLQKQESTEADPKYSHSNLNDTQREDLVSRIKDVLSNPDIICKPGFSSKELAGLVNSNTTYVSQVINETFGVSFSILLGNYRVREACRLINGSDQSDRMTIEGIANTVGFKSRTAFLSAFKREVGLTPSEYIRLASEEKKKDS